MPKTSLYNHNEVQNIIPNRIFKWTAKSLKTGKTGMYEKVKLKYGLTKFQKQYLKNLYNDIRFANG